MREKVEEKKERRAREWPKNEVKHNLGSFLEQMARNFSIEKKRET